MLTTTAVTATGGTPTLPPWTNGITMWKYFLRHGWNAAHKASARDLQIIRYLNLKKVIEDVYDENNWVAQKISEF